MSLLVLCLWLCFDLCSLAGRLVVGHLFGLLGFDVCCVFNCGLYSFAIVLISVFGQFSLLGFASLDCFDECFMLFIDCGFRYLWLVVEVVGIAWCLLDD